MRKAILATVLLLGGCSACDFHVEGDKTRLDDLTERVMKLEKSQAEADANFKAIGQFAQQTTKQLGELAPKPPGKPSPSVPTPGMSPAP